MFYVLFIFFGPVDCGMFGMSSAPKSKMLQISYEGVWTPETSKQQPQIQSQKMFGAVVAFFFVERFWVSLVGHEHCQLADVWEARNEKLKF